MKSGSMRADGNGLSVEHRMLLACLDEAFDHRAWHGTTLRGSVRGLGAAEAAWRPGRARHSIWEIVWHCAYWKYAVRRRLTAARRGSFALDGSNWFAQPAHPSDRAWRDAVRLLQAEHQQLRAAVRNARPGALARTPTGSPFSQAALIRGAAAHDLYHTGQIQLLKRLRRSRTR